MRTPELDLTPSDLTLRLRRGSYRLIQLTFSDRDFTGATGLLLRYQPKDSATVSTLAGTFPTTVRMEFAPDTPEWTALDGVTEGAYQIEYTDAASKLVIEVSGEFIVEDSL